MVMVVSETSDDLILP